MALALAALVAVLHGTVTRGPVTPVCRVGTPCDAPAAHTLLTFAGHTTTSVRTDAGGHYRVRLAPGRYVVRAASGVRIEPSQVTVRAGTQRRDLAIDTGIR